MLATKKTDKIKLTEKFKLMFGANDLNKLVTSSIPHCKKKHLCRLLHVTNIIT